MHLYLVCLEDSQIVVMFDCTGTTSSYLKALCSVIVLISLKQHCISYTQHYADQPEGSSDPGLDEPQSCEYT